MCDLFIVRKKSAKGRDYFSLFVDFGYRTQSLTYDTAIICALCNITEQSLYDSLEEDKPFKVGSIDINFGD